MGVFQRCRRQSPLFTPKLLPSSRPLEARVQITSDVGTSCCGVTQPRNDEIRPLGPLLELSGLDDNLAVLLGLTTLQMAASSLLLGLTLVFQTNFSRRNFFLRLLILTIFSLLALLS